MLAGDQDIQQVCDWIQDLTGEVMQEKMTLEGLHSFLSSGVVLVRLINRIMNKQLKYNQSRLPFKQMENIGFFLKEVQELGVPSFESFQTVDLYEAKNMPQVVRCLIAVSRMAQKKGLVEDCIGPKLQDKNVREFLPKSGEVTVPLLTKHTSKAGTVVFGSKRQIGGVYKDGVAECEIDTSPLNGIRGTE
jgi:hypothetical protein